MVNRGRRNTSGGGNETRGANLLSLQRLQVVDAVAPSFVLALNVARLEDTGTKNRPVPFLCSDGGIYWLKPEANASEASAELIAGRLGRLTGHAPAAVVVE